MLTEKGLNCQGKLQTGVKLDFDDIKCGNAFIYVICLIQSKLCMQIEHRVQVVVEHVS